MAELPQLMIFIDIKSIEYVRQPAIRFVLPFQPRIGFIYMYRMQVAMLFESLRRVCGRGCVGV